MTMLNFNNNNYYLMVYTKANFHNTTKKDDAVF